MPATRNYPNSKRARYTPSTRKPSSYSKAPPRSLANKSFVTAGKGFPKKMQMTHKYSAIVNLIGTAGASGYFQFSCNGMYDPDTGGIGHQPYYFDQMAAIYDHYTVIGSKITAKITPFLSVNEAAVVTVAKNDDTTITNSSPLTQAEYSEAKQVLIPANSNSHCHYLSSSWSAKKTFGGSILGNDALQGTDSANPSEQTFYTFSIKAADSASTVGMYCIVQVEYTAIWDELKDVAGS